MLYLITICVLLFLNRIESAPYNVTNKSNTCKTYDDYLHSENNPNCWYNPDVEDDMDVIVARHGYPFEKYKVTSQDGYITSMFRLPKQNPRGIVMLVHPASASAMAWVNFGNSSFGFELWDAGYDVWLANIRGSYYGREHEYLNPNSAEYWDFSFHEMGVFDHPAQVDFIREKTNYSQKVACIGHSLGGTSLYVYGALRPEHTNRHVNVLIPMAAGSRFRHIKSNIMKMFGGLLTNDVWELAKQVGMAEIIPKDGLIANVRKAICNSGLMNFVCTLMDSVIYGVTPNENSAEFQPIVHSQYPAGMSVKVYAHFSQCIRHNGDFIFYDYGPRKNKEIYGNVDPPEYPMHRVSTPIYMVYASEDLVCSTRDQEEFFDSFSDAGKKYGKFLVKGLSHSDLLYSKNVAEKVNLPIIKFLQTIPST